MLKRAGLHLLLVTALGLGGAVGCPGALDSEEPPAPPVSPRAPARQQPMKPAPAREPRVDEARLEERARASVANAEQLLDQVDQLIAEETVRDAGRAPLLISRAKIRIDRRQFQEAAELAEQASAQLADLLPSDAGSPATPESQPALTERRRTEEPPAEVAAAPPPRPPPRPAEPRRVPAGREPDRSNHKDLEATLSAYRLAFEACDTFGLQTLWRMSETQVDAYQQICARGKPEVRAEAISAPQVAGDIALMCMDYHVTVKSAGRRVSLKKRGAYTGEFVRRPDGWQIVTIREGCSESLARASPSDSSKLSAAESPTRRARSAPSRSAAAGTLERFATLESPRVVAAGEEFAVQVALTVSQITQDVTILDGHGSKPGMVQIDPPTQFDARATPEPAGNWNTLDIDIVLSAAGFGFPSGSNMGRVRVSRVGDSETALFRMRAPKRAPSPVQLYATFWRDGVFLGRAMSEIRLEPSAR